jgi:hypothetical protein
MPKIRSLNVGRNVDVKGTLRFDLMSFEHVSWIDLTQDVPSLCDHGDELFVL